MMDKVDDPRLATLADIVLPPPPDWRPFWIIAFGAVAVALMTLAFITQIRRNRAKQFEFPHPTALTELARIEQQWQHGTLADREAAYRLAAVLRIGLNISPLTPQPPPLLATDALRWETLVGALSMLRYAPDTHRLDAQWFHWIRDWLRAAEIPRA